MVQYVFGSGGGDGAAQRWLREYLQQRHFTCLVAARAFIVL